MKKPVFIFLFILASAAGCYAGSGKKSNPVTDNTAIKHSKREQAKQTKEFTDDRRYGNIVNSHAAKALRRKQAKSGGHGQ